MLQEKNISSQDGHRKASILSNPAQPIPARPGWVRNWPSWTPYAALVWSLVYAALGLYWAVSGRGFPYAPGSVDTVLGPLAGRFGPVVAWILVIVTGIPAAALAAVMLRRIRVLRPLWIIAGVLLTGVFLLVMTDINLLIMLGYLPYSLVKLLSGSGFGQAYMKALAQWSLVHQLFCLIGGFLWLAATGSYVRRSTDACLYCGRRNSRESWNNPERAARWGRIAVYVAIFVPVIYAVTRYAWALGIPLGMTQASLRLGQERGTWTSGLFLATFGLVGAALMLGLVQRWGEVFPRWVIGLAGRRVPIALAVVPASIVSVLLMVGGLTIWSGWTQMAATAAASGQNMLIVVGPTTLFPVWAVSLAIATLGYYYRRRGRCTVCGRGRH